MILSSYLKLNKKFQIKSQSKVFKCSYALKPKNLIEVQKQMEDGKTSELFNIPVNVQDKLSKNLHLTHAHPLATIKILIQDYFQNEWAPQNGVKMATYDDLSPILTTYQAFDELLFPPNHPGRSPSDTYYVTPSTVLRPHTSAHQQEIIRSGSHTFLCTGDVYRRDEIDATHYPVFHQMEGLHIFNEDVLRSMGNTSDQYQFVVKNMKTALIGMVRKLFGDVEYRWNYDDFPFTDPSFELEIFYNGAWLEVLGCGVIHQRILRNCELDHLKGWAFGLGLERLAMILFGIPDIRLFWSLDERMLSQFEHGKISTFKPFSKYPECVKDISFWIPSDFNQNSFFDLVRDIAGDLVENVKLIDHFEHPKTKVKSNCFRIIYRSMERNLLNSEIDEIQMNLRKITTEKLRVELR